MAVLGRRDSGALSEDSAEGCLARIPAFESDFFDAQLRVGEKPYCFVESEFLPRGPVAEAGFPLEQVPEP
jgi:hypothetical protein